MLWNICQINVCLFFNPRVLIRFLRVSRLEEVVFFILERTPDFRQVWQDGGVFPPNQDQDSAVGHRVWSTINVNFTTKERIHTTEVQIDFSSFLFGRQHWESVAWNETDIQFLKSRTLVIPAVVLQYAGRVQCWLLVFSLNTTRTLAPFSPDECFTVTLKQRWEQWLVRIVTAGKLGYIMWNKK